MKPTYQRHLLRYAKRAYEDREAVVDTDLSNAQAAGLIADQRELPLEATTEAERELAERKAKVGLALTSGLTALGLPDGRSTKWFDESIVGDKRIATRVTKVEVVQPDDNPTTDSISEYRIEVGVTKLPVEEEPATTPRFSQRTEPQLPVDHVPFGDDNDPDFFTLNWATIGFYNSPEGIEDPVVLVAGVTPADNIDLYRAAYNSVAMNEVVYTVAQAPALFKPAATV